MRALRFRLAAALVIIEATAATALHRSEQPRHAGLAHCRLRDPGGVHLRRRGDVALWRRPDNVTGSLLAATGYLWFIAALTESNNSWLFTIGFVFSNLAFVAFVALILAYPDGRLTRRAAILVSRRRSRRVDRQRPRGPRRREPLDGLRRRSAECGRGRRLADGRLGRDVRLDRDHCRRPRADRGGPRRPLAPRLGHEPANAPPRLPLLWHLPRAADGLGRDRLGLGQDELRHLGALPDLVRPRAAVVPRGRAPQPLRPRQCCADPPLARCRRPAPQRGRGRIARPVPRDRLPPGRSWGWVDADGRDAGSRPRRPSEP